MRISIMDAPYISWGWLNQRRDRQLAVDRKRKAGTVGILATAECFFATGQRPQFPKGQFDHLAPKAQLSGAPLSSWFVD